MSVIETFRPAALSQYPEHGDPQLYDWMKQIATGTTTQSTVNQIIFMNSDCYRKCYNRYVIDKLTAADRYSTQVAIQCDESQLWSNAGVGCIALGGFCGFVTVITASIPCCVIGGFIGGLWIYYTCDDDALIALDADQRFADLVFNRCVALCGGN